MVGLQKKMRNGRMTKMILQKTKYKKTNGKATQKMESRRATMEDEYGELEK